MYRRHFLGECLRVLNRAALVNFPLTFAEVNIKKVPTNENPSPIRIYMLVLRLKQKDNLYHIHSIDLYYPLISSNQYIFSS